MGQIDINGQDQDEPSNNNNLQNNITDTYLGNLHTNTVMIPNNHNAEGTANDLIDDDNEYYYLTYQWHNAGDELHEKHATITCSAHDHIETLMRTKYTSTVTRTDRKYQTSKYQLLCRRSGL